MDSETVEDGNGRVARRTSPDSMSFIAVSDEGVGPATAKAVKRSSIKNVLVKIGAALITR